MSRSIRERVRPTNCGVSHGAMPLVNIYKIGRNEPCPCGSGLKFKKCCLDPKEKPNKEIAKVEAMP